MKKFFSKKRIIVFIIVLVLLLALAYLIHDDYCKSFLKYGYYCPKPRVISILFTEGTDMNRREEIIESFSGRILDCFPDPKFGFCNVQFPENWKFTEIQELLENNPDVESINNEPWGIYIPIDF